MSTDRIHLHRDDCPATLELLRALIGDRSIDGWEPTAEGAFVGWDELTSSYLSSTEKATVNIARGCAVAERSGGLAPRLRTAVLATVEAVA